MALSFPSIRPRNPRELYVNTDLDLPWKRQKTTPYPIEPVIYSSPRPTRGRSLKRARQHDDLEGSKRFFNDQHQTRLTALQLSRAWDLITKQVNWPLVAAEVDANLSEQYQEDFRNIVYDEIERAIEREQQKIQVRPDSRILQNQNLRTPQTSKLCTVAEPIDSPNCIEYIEIASSDDEDSDATQDEDLDGQAKMETKGGETNDQDYQPSLC